MATKDLRFFDFPDAQVLPDGHPRRGISVVAALGEWLIHTNRRRNGARVQRYEHGVPVTDLAAIAGDGTTGTTAHFRPDETLRAGGGLTAHELVRLASSWRHLTVEVDHERAVASRHLSVMSAPVPPAPAPAPLVFAALGQMG